ncbi:MAG: 30S ribosomal protein S8 [Minisyncoccia bacterium]|jgi:small subunit ribosomal protein S8
MYYHFLSEIKNAMQAHKEKLALPFSKMDFAVLKLLVEAGYLKSVERETIGKRSMVVVRLSYRDKKSAMNDFKIISKPSRHQYMDYRSLRRVKQGYGIGVLSTSRGIMTEREAKKNKVGGEYLFEIW